MISTLSVCLSVRPQGYLRNHARSLPSFLCMLPMAMGQFWGFSSPMTMHCNVFAVKRDQSIANNVTQQMGSFRHCRVRCKWDRPEGGDGSAQHGRNVTYNCLVAPCILYYLSNQSKNKLSHKQCGQKSPILIHSMLMSG